MKKPLCQTIKFTGLCMRALLLPALLIAWFGAPAQAQVIRPFTLRFDTNTLGDIAIIGNTLLTSTNPAVRDFTAPAALLVNNANNMVRVDVDSDTNTFNSSSANLTIPAGGSVLYAALYWGAGTNAGAGGVAAVSPTNNNKVLLSFNGGAYSTVTAATNVDTEVAGRYQGSRDITTYVQTNGSGA